VEPPNYLINAMNLPGEGVGEHVGDLRASRENAELDLSHGSENQVRLYSPFEPYAMRRTGPAVFQEAGEAPGWPLELSCNSALVLIYPQTNGLVRPCIARFFSLHHGPGEYVSPWVSHCPQLAATTAAIYVASYVI
jgi:hypothetical protein